MDWKTNNNDIQKSDKYILFNYCRQNFDGDGDDDGEA